MKDTPKLLPQSVKLLKFDDLYERIEYATRTCYKSLNKSSEETRENFILDKVKKKHFSVLEHSNIPVRWRFSEDEMDDALYIYQWLQAVKGESNARLFITLDDTVTVLVMSGNVRAWLDFLGFDMWDSHLFNEGFLEMLETTLSAKYPLFFMDKKVKASGEVEVISEEEAFKYGQEHRTFTFEVFTDRATTHQLVRHRDFSYSQESQRYCNYSSGKFGSEITFCSDGLGRINDNLFREQYSYDILLIAEKAYMEMIRLGVPAEDARSVLPNATGTTIIVSGTYKQFMSFIEKRDIPQAQNNIRNIAISMKTQIEEEINGQ